MKSIKGKVITSIILIVIALVVYMALVYFPCPGTYKFEKAIMSNGMELKVGDNLFGVSITEEYLVLKLESNGEFVIMQGNSEVSGVWEENGSKVVLTAKNGNKIFAEKNFGKITIELEGDKYVLKKPLFFIS